jgi:hypothetical protein
VLSAAEGDSKLRSRDAQSLNDGGIIAIGKGTGNGVWRRSVVISHEMSILPSYGLWVMSMLELMAFVG